jgi:hypothetical protein
VVSTRMFSTRMFSRARKLLRFNTCFVLHGF